MAEFGENLNLRDTQKVSPEISVILYWKITLTCFVKDMLQNYCGNFVTNNEKFSSTNEPDVDRQIDHPGSHNFKVCSQCTIVILNAKPTSQTAHL